MIIYKFGWIFRKLYPSYTWRRKVKEKVIYLTFDDGPIPEVTEYVLEILHKFNAKATFFCVGGNVEKYPEVFEKIKTHGHRLGNHTFNHLHGWSTPDDEYLQNIEKCSDVMNLNDSKPLFRPPYGKIKKSQAKLLDKKYEIVMWEVLSNDFNPSLEKERCLKKSIKYTRPGSIVLFHDSVKTFEKIQYVLPKYLEHFSSKGYKFHVL